MSMPVGVRELADAANVSPGSASKLPATLTTEGIVERDERGRVTTARRRVLLDALTALGAHREDLILVGAQAVYHHTVPSDLNVALMTTDGDLAINTTDLAEAPEISATLGQAGFIAGTPDTGSRPMT